MDLGYITAFPFAGSVLPTPTHTSVSSLAAVREGHPTHLCRVRFGWDAWRAQCIVNRGHPAYVHSRARCTCWRFYGRPAKYMPPDGFFGIQIFVKIQFLPGLCPGPCWGSLQRFPDSLVGWGGERRISPPHFSPTRRLWRRGSVVGAQGTVMP